MKLTTIFHLLALCIGLFFGANAAAGELTSVQIKSAGVDTRLIFAIKTSSKPTVFFMGGERPRVVIDVEDSALSPSLLPLAKANHGFTGKGAVKHVRYAVRNAKGIRFAADLEDGARYVSHAYKDGVLTVFVKGQTQMRLFQGIPYPRLKRMPAVDKASEPESALTKALVPLVPVPKLKHSRRLAAVHKPVIVIDPGHGGRDPGAIGRAKVREETVTLQAALELKRQLLKTGKYKVVLTRKSDTYISLEKRVLIARKAGAELFISLHADSLAKSTTRGASVYTLADRAQKRGQRLVNTQNWILDVDLSQQSSSVSDILVDLAQRKTLSKSGEFADVLVPELAKKTKLLGNTHREAGLYVLLAPDVPAVLLEMGFLSNRADEKLLNSPSHRKKLMKGVTKAINMYFKSQTTLHAAR